jgi:hypothetical protein
VIGVRDLIGLAVLLICAIVPLWTVRPLLGVVFTILERRARGELSPPGQVPDSRLGGHLKTLRS